VFIDFYQQWSEITAWAAPRTREIESHNLPNQIADLDLKIKIRKKHQPLTNQNLIHGFFLLPVREATKKRAFS
jgi:hypothetical protein